MAEERRLPVARRPPARDPPAEELHDGQRRRRRRSTRRRASRSSNRSSARRRSSTGRRREQRVLDVLAGRDDVVVPAGTGRSRAAGRRSRRRPRRGRRRSRSRPAVRPAAARARRGPRPPAPRPGRREQPGRRGRCAHALAPIVVSQPGWKSTWTSRIGKASASTQAPGDARGNATPRSPPNDVRAATGGHYSGRPDAHAPPVAALRYGARSLRKRSALGFLASILAARRLGPAESGTSRSRSSPPGFFQVLLDLTVEEAMIKYGFRYTTDASSGGGSAGSIAVRWC